MTRRSTLRHSSPPINVSAPEVDGAPEVGATLTAVPGSWIGAPLVREYRWEREIPDSGGPGGAINWGNMPTWGTMPTWATIQSGSGGVVTPPTNTTGGTGGSFTDTTNIQFTASNSQTSRYHVYAAGLPQDKPLGIMLQFHGDAAFEFLNPTSTYSYGGQAGLTRQAKLRDMLFVPVLAPDTTGSITWWETGAANSVFVSDLMDYLFSRYNINLDRIWLVGYSGGAQFISQFFVPLFSSKIKSGGAVIFGGGGRPYNITPQPFDPSFVSNFKMHWYTGANDTGTSPEFFNALNDPTHGAVAGKAWYDARSFITSNEWPAGVGHDLTGRFGPVTGQILDLHDNPPAVVSGSAQRSSGTTMTWTGVVARSPRVVLRASATPLTGQTGWYEMQAPAQNGSVTVTISSLTAGTAYYWQLESGNAITPETQYGTVLASGILSA